jgi:hypothetical protein
VVTGGDQTPAVSARAAAALPAGTTPLSGAEWREAVQRVQASYKRGQRRGGWRRSAARGTLPARAGMNRRAPPPEPDGNDAA